VSRAAVPDRNVLVRRLAEAEATISALLTGQIDAVTDTGSGIPLLLADAQEALRESESRLREQGVVLRNTEERTNYALGAAKMGVWEVDLRTNAVTWSASTAALYGLTLDQAPRDSDAYLKLVHVDDRAAVANEIGRAIADGGEFGMEFRVLWPDGSAHWTEGRARVLRDANGVAISVVGIGIDITEQKALEAQFRQAQKMEAVGQLAGGVAHDFNNLLTVIMSYTEMLIPTVELTDPRRSDLGEILSAATAAAALTRQLLVFSRQQVLQPKIIDINDVVGGTEKMLRRLISEDVGITTVLGADTGVVRADAGQIEQVLMNLAVNAQQAMALGGSITIRTCNLDLHAADADAQLPGKPGRYVMISVTDTGSGMDEVTKSHIFEPFFTTKPVGKGTGLGLATVFGIVKQHDGFIRVDSAIGRGTTFEICLPRVDEIATPVFGGARTIEGGRETVLVVDDDAQVRVVLRRTLEHYGYSVLEAPNGRTAIATAARHEGEIDLLITDVVLPEMNGRELYERLRAVRERLPVLFLSGYNDDHVLKQDGFFGPGVAFQSKPFVPETLARRVREALDIVARDRGAVAPSP
jgi:two-component system cell cycle sensor histidine kinase/response regulator CckA